MRAIVQRVNEASVSIEGENTRSISQGILAYACMTEKSTTDDFQWMCNKIHNLRIFTDSQGKLNLSLIDIKKVSSLENIGILLIPNFSLFASIKKGNRPSFARAIALNNALEKFSQLVKTMQDYSNAHNISIETGTFGADMQIHSVADGPMNIIIDSPSLI